MIIFQSIFMMKSKDILRGVAKIPNIGMFAYVWASEGSYGLDIHHRHLQSLWLSNSHSDQEERIDEVTERVADIRGVNLEGIGG